MPILNLTCLINIACIIEDISFDSLSPRDRREASADTNRNFDFTIICNDYTPEAGQVKGLLYVSVPDEYFQKEEILKRSM